MRTRSRAVERPRAEDRPAARRRGPASAALALHPAERLLQDVAMERLVVAPEPDQQGAAGRSRESPRPGSRGRPPRRGAGRRGPRSPARSPRAARRSAPPRRASTPPGRARGPGGPARRPRRRAGWRAFQASTAAGPKSGRERGGLQGRDRVLLGPHHRHLHLLGRHRRGVARLPAELQLRRDLPAAEREIAERGEDEGGGEHRAEDQERGAAAPTYRSSRSRRISCSISA